MKHIHFLHSTVYCLEFALADAIHRVFMFQIKFDHHDLGYVLFELKLVYTVNPCIDNSPFTFIRATQRFKQGIWNDHL
jgi:hypothetical protein